MEALGIYIHIPFCRKKCSYCDFYSVEDCSSGMLDGYVSALEKQFADFFHTAGSLTADSVYIGGGTPSVLGGRRIARILKALSKRVNISRMAEITLECNPESVDKSLMKSVQSAGVNRVSLGVQSASDAELLALGRVHAFETAEKAAAIVKQYCTGNLSIDLMYGLPGQTRDGWRDTLERALALNPRHVSCYSLKLEPGTPMFKLAPNLPCDDEQADMYLLAVDFLQERGFAQYEISNFAQPGFLSRHNSKYWSLAPYVGFGCAAHSFFGGKRFGYARDAAGFIRSGACAVDVDEDAFYERVGEYIMLGLRTARGVGESEMLERFDTDFAPFAQRLEKYKATGHAAFDGERWRLTPKGFLVSNTIIADLLECRAGEAEAK